MTPTTSEPEKLRYQVFYNSEWNDETEDMYLRMINNNHHGRVLNSKGVTVESTTTPMTEPKTAKPPIWYTEEEMFHWLKRENYSETIAKELSGMYANYLQGAFKKGFEKGQRSADQQTSQLQEQLKEKDKLISELVGRSSSKKPATQRRSEMKNSIKIIILMVAALLILAACISVKKQPKTSWENKKNYLIIQRTPTSV